MKSKKDIVQCQYCNEKCWWKAQKYIFPMSFLQCPFFIRGESKFCISIKCIKYHDYGIWHLRSRIKYKIKLGLKTLERRRQMMKNPERLDRWFALFLCHICIAEFFPGPIFQIRPDPPGSGPDPTWLLKPIIWPDPTHALSDPTRPVTRSCPDQRFTRVQFSWLDPTHTCDVHTMML